MGWLDRIFNAVEGIVDRLTGREDEPPLSFPQVPEPSFDDLEQLIKDKVVPFDFDRDIPEIGSLPPDEPAPLTDYDTMADEMELDDQPIAKWALYAGWFDMDRDTDERVIARKLFFDETGMEKRSFPWHAWREWYANAA